jgi:negative elongation factor B
MLPLLDLHGVPRLDFHTSILEELRDKLVQQINDTSSKMSQDQRERKLKELLNKSFPLIRVKQLRPAVMTILRNMKQIDDKYLRVLVRDRELYAGADVEVKRQIWRDNQSLFGDEVSPELSQYIRVKDTIIYDHLNLNNLFFMPSPKVRRGGEVVQKLAHMIGSSVKLYDMVLQFLRTLFLRTRNVHYCTLRAELLMALHDLDIQEIISVDPCHKFTWCLDACIREKQVDIKRSRELQGFLDNIKRGHEQILGDLSMTLCDPYAINFLASSAIKILLHLVSVDQLPRSNSILILLLRMLSLGLSAWRMIDTQDFKESKFDIQILTKFLPALTSLMVDDQARNFHSKLPPDERANALLVIDHEGPVPEAIEAYIQESSVASILTMYYALHVAKQKDRIGLLRILTVLSSCKEERAYEDTFLHSLIAALIPMADEFSNEDFFSGLFDGFLFTGLTRDNVSKHIMKLLWYIHPKINRTRLNTLMKGTKNQN